MPRRYILWDHDGVLVDTEKWFFAATRDVMRGLGVDLSQEIYLDYMTRGQSCWDLCSDRGMSDQEILRHRGIRDARYREHLQTQPIEVEGVVDVLATLSKSFEMAVVTTARRADVELIHESRGLLGFFQFVLTIEDYQHPKPDPDPYLAALERFGAGPDQAVVIEDSARGLHSALEAGIDCLVVRSPFTAAQDFTGAWRVVDSISEVPGVLTA
jgi:HAD superfamily hydrolase (TIGR01509 family)